MNHKTINAVFLGLLLLLLSPVSALAQSGGAQTSGEDDPVLQAMRAELERSKAQLKLEQMAAPYYIDYHATDVDTYTAEAAYGAVRAETRNHVRYLRVVVRVGDYKLDSFFGPAQGAAGPAQVMVSPAQGIVDFMSLDNDVLTLRRQLWLATDRAYKAALEGLAAKNAQLKQLTIDQPVDDFARSEALQMVSPLVKLDVNPQPWIKMIKQASAIYKKDIDVQYLDSSLRFMAVNRYYTNSEGTVTRNGQTTYELEVSGVAQAADGMRLDRSHNYVVTNIHELPSEADLMAEANKLLASFKELRAAPIVDEDYHGPVLFSADAASNVLADLVGENVLGRKPNLGQSARTTGDWSANYKARVLPEFLSVVDDPTINSIAGHSLLGGYAVDDEGVKSQRVSLIDNGKLVNYVIGRAPIRDFPASNGHGRARVPNSPPGPSIGNLIVKSAQPVPSKQLKEKLIALCHERDLPYGYYVETMGPQRTPRLLYKIWVKDGHEELVRGAIFGSLDTRALRDNLIAAGDDVNVENRVLNIPHSYVNPSILFDDLEVKRADNKNDKLPDYPVPALVSGK